MEKYFARLYEKIRHAGLIIILLSSKDEGTWRQTGITDQEIKIKKNLLHKIYPDKNRLRNISLYKCWIIFFHLINNVKPGFEWRSKTNKK